MCKSNFMHIQEVPQYSLIMTGEVWFFVLHLLPSVLHCTCIVKSNGDDFSYHVALPSSWN